MKITDFANLNSTAKGGLQVLVGDLALQVTKDLERQVAELLDRGTVHEFRRQDGSAGKTGKLGIVEVEFRPSIEGLGWLQAIRRAKIELASADAVFG